MKLRLIVERDELFKLSKSKLDEVGQLGTIMKDNASTLRVYYVQKLLGVYDTNRSNNLMLKHYC